MAKQSSKETLAEKISDILNAAPASLDPEDDENDDTRAKIATSYLEDDKDVFEDEIPRRKLSSTIEDYDERYAGKKLSRKDLEDDSSDENDTVEADSDTDESEADQGSDLDGSEEESENSAEESEDFVEGSGEEDDFKHINESSVSKETSKGVCVKNQISIWESLLEMRIQLQKCLITSNKMPQHDTYKHIRELNDSDFIKKSAETKHNVSHLLDKLLLLQSLVLKQYPETKSLSSETVKDHESDEEIPSDTDEEIKSDNEETASDKPKEVVRKRKQSDYERDISETHSKYRKYRDSVIQKWNDKTKVLLAKNKDSTSVLAQIDYLLSDREKLLNRTRTKRSSYEILGKPAAEGSAETVTYDPEIFDDDDFYGVTTTMTTPVPYVVIHHSYIPEACYTESTCVNAMKVMQTMHQQTNGWLDIGYSFAVGGDLRAYEGRGWDTVGAHAPSYNDKSIGICVIGDWSDELPDPEQLDVVKALIDYGIEIGKIQEDYYLVGHRQVRNGTVCPGDRFFTEIQTWDHYLNETDKANWI